MDITNKIAIVTGASYGISRATARLFAQNGAKLVLAARSKDKLDELASEPKDSMAVQAALNMISLTAREELAKDRIVVSVVYPYITATDFEKNTLRSAGKKASGSSNGEERSGDIPPADPPEKVARAILELVESGQVEFIMNPWIEKGGKSNA